MSNLPRNNMNFFWWLRGIQALWVRTKVVPADPLAELGLRPGVPVCYVLPSRSVTDLLVLDQVCRRFKLPLPVHKPTALKFPGSAAFIYMQKLGLLQVERDRAQQPPSPFLRLVQQATADRTMDVQLVPVAVFWGRNPGREERSVMKLLFFDDEHAGILQKFFIVLAQGRQNFLHLGKPISLRALVDESLGGGVTADAASAAAAAAAPAKSIVPYALSAAPHALSAASAGGPPALHGTLQTAKKLRRVLRVHFLRQRTAALGPSLPSRASVVSQLMKTKAIREAVRDEARKKKLPLERAEQRARRYLAEIASEQQYSVVRLADIFLSWLWNRLFNGVVVTHAHRLRELEQTHEIVYLPSHRSHMDYLLLSYSLYYEGFVPPHTMAGINLNFWPVGPLLRRCGAFYARRSFGGNRLYTVAYNEYVHYLLTKGHPLKFYPEGGRSRTGRLLPPKTGMLAMTVQSYLRNSDRPIVYVPIFLGYEKVMEVSTYQTELRGKAKAKESVRQLFQARRVLKTNFGKAYIGIGEPIYLKPFLDARHPGWRDEPRDPDVKPKWLHPVVAELANETLTRVNSTAVVSPLALFALVILSAPSKAMAEDDLLYLMEKLAAAMAAAPYSRDVTMPAGTARDQLRHAMGVAKVERFQHPGGDVIFMEERESILLTYYRNNVLHLVAVPSLIASFFQHNDRMREVDLVRSASAFYPFLKQEYFLRWDAADGPKVVASVIEALVRQALLFRDDFGHLCRPDVASRDLTSLMILSRALGQTLERYAISTALLAKHVGEVVERKEFEAQCQLMAQRIAILNGVNEPEFYDVGLFRTYIDQLSGLGYIGENSGGRFTVDGRVRELAANSLSLLSGDVRQSLQRTQV